MPLKTLHHLAQNACIKNKRSLVDVGDLQYRQIKAVLEAIDSPTQLHLIETNSPQIRGEDVELWQKFIARDIPSWQTKNYVPSNPLNWYKVYRKYKKEQQMEIRRDEEILKASLAGIKKIKETNVSKVVDLKMLPKLPRDRKMIYNAGVPIGKKGFKKDTPSSLVWSAGSKTKLTDGRSVITRARREAKEISQRGKLSTPTNQLSGSVAQIKRAPAGMVNEYRRAAEPPLKILAKKRNPVGKLPESGPSLEEREKRLRALTSVRKHASAMEETVVGSSDSEDVDSMDELFDEPPRSSASSRPTSMTPSLHSRPPSKSSSRPIQSSERGRNYQSSSSPPLKPSDLISSMVSKPKPIPRSMGSSPQVSRGSSPSGFRRSPSPRGERKPPMMQRKRPEVDVFNRKPKRPRIG